MPTGFSGVPPPGPAMPVIATVNAASLRCNAPSAIAVRANARRAPRPTPRCPDHSSAFVRAGAVVIRVRGHKPEFSIYGERRSVFRVNLQIGVRCAVFPRPTQKLRDNLTRRSAAAERGVGHHIVNACEAPVECDLTAANGAGLVPRNDRARRERRARQTFEMGGALLRR